MGRLVCMLLSNDAVSDPRVEKEATALASAGYRVVVIAWNRSGKAAASEVRPGFEIVRVGPPARHGGGLANIGRYRAFWDDAARAASDMGADVIHCHDADTIVAGRAALRRLKRSGRKPSFVVDFHELYRDSKMVPQRGAVGVFARLAASRVERAGVSDANLVLVANPGTADYYQALGAADVLVIENAPELTAIDAVEAKPHDGFNVCFIGQKRYFESLRVLMDAVTGLDGVSALIAGGGVDERRVAEYAIGRDNIATEGRLLYSEIPSRYAQCDAVYAVNDPGVGNMRVNFPVKAIEGMAFGRPIIVATGTWIGEYVEKQGIGLAVDVDVRSVREAIVRLRDDHEMADSMGRRGRQLVEQGLNWEAISSKLVSGYERLRCESDA